MSNGLTGRKRKAFIPISSVDEVEQEFLGEPLTPAQWIIAAWVNEGLCNREIAARCNVTVDTVKHHLYAIMDRIEAKNRTRAEVSAWYERKRIHATPGAAPQCPVRKNPR